MKAIIKVLKVSLIAIFALSLLISCKKEEDTEPITENEDFYEFMQEWYFWYQEIPTISPTQYRSPYEVLEAIRYRPIDRWSYISRWADFEAYYQESKFIGYGFGTVWDQNGKLRISFIFNKTNLYQQGVRRGWIIESINGISVQPGTNVSQMLGLNQVGVTNNIRFLRPDQTTFEITASKEEVIMNSVLHKEVFTHNERKIAYLVLQGFTEPTLAELDEAFEQFSMAEVDELILDLRYNGGGLTSIANYLASMIGGSKIQNKVFINYSYNDKKAAERNRSFLFNDEIKYSLDLDRLFVIASKQTASASEVVINGLEPFMPVMIVGNDTYGKPMGMNVFKYSGVENEYAFVPITFKSNNADGFGDYFDGLPADVYAPDDISRNFGDTEEASLKAALNFIETGTIAKGMEPQPFADYQPRFDMTGLRFIIGAH